MPASDAISLSLVYRPDRFKQTVCLSLPNTSPCRAYLPFQQLLPFTVRWTPRLSSSHLKDFGGCAWKD